MADRTRTPDVGRTPEAVVPDTVAETMVQRDMEDFAPTLKGGMAAGEGHLGVNTDAINFLADGGFESDDPFAYWSVTAPAAPTRSNTWVYDGNYSARLNNGATGGTWYMVSDAVDCTEGDIFTYGMHCRASSVTANRGTANVSAVFYDENDVQIVTGPFAQSMLIQGTFVPFTGTDVAPAGAVKAALYIIVTVPANEAYHVDNAFLRPGTRLVGAFASAMSDESTNRIEIGQQMRLFSGHVYEDTTAPGRLFVTTTATTGVNEGRDQIVLALEGAKSSAGNSPYINLYTASDDTVAGSLIYLEPGPGGYILMGDEVNLADNWLRMDGTVGIKHKRFSNITLDGAGDATFAHGLGSTIPPRVLSAEASYKGNSGEYKVMNVNYIDGTNVRITGGIASREAHVNILYIDTGSW